MSQSLRTKTESIDEIRAQMGKVFDHWGKSAQAYGDVSLDRHNDGERMHKDFGMAPFHKYLAMCERRGKNVATYPSAWVAPLVHLRDWEIELVEQLSYGDDGEPLVDYDPNDPHPSHEALEQFPRLRAKTLEWIADDDGTEMPRNASGSRRIDAWVEGGTDYHAYGAPGAGKSTLMAFTIATLQQVNNETVLLADTMDDSGTNERSEWIPLAPWATAAIPAGIPVDVRIVPENDELQELTVDLEDVFRDVIRYESVTDLLGQLVPGQFYVAFPDPLHRGAEDVAPHAYHGPEAVTPVGDQGPNGPTPADQWWFAFFNARIKQDIFTHWTSVMFDEAGNIFDPEAEKDEHEEYNKITKFSKDFADARKKGVSVYSYSHAMAELHPKYRAKQRWWITMNGMEPPVGKSLPGEKSCPIPTTWYTQDMESGEAMTWNSSNYASISWPNLKRGARLDAEVSIDFDLGAVGL